MKFDKKKVVFGSVVATVITFMVTYSIWQFGADEKKDQDSISQTSVPNLDDEAQKDYQTRLEGLDDIKDVKPRTAPSIYDEKLIDEDGLFDSELESKKKAAIVDSIYSKGRMKYANKNNSAPKRVNTTESKMKKIAKAQSDFFRNVPAKANKGNNGTTDDIIYAEVNGDQKLANQGRLTMRITEDAIINGNIVLKNTYVYGFVKFKTNRAMVTINHIEQDPVSLMAYDVQDGGEGIYVLNSFQEELKERSTDITVGDINIPGFPQVNGLKNIIRKKNRQVKVTIVNKYQILLKPFDDEQENENNF